MSSKQLKEAKRLRPGWSYNKALGLFYRGGRRIATGNVVSPWAKSTPSKS